MFCVRLVTVVTDSGRMYHGLPGQPGVGGQPGLVRQVGGAGEEAHDVRHGVEANLVVAAEDDRTKG